MNTRLKQLEQCIEQLANSIENVRWAVVEAQQDGAAHALADQFESAVTDLDGLLRQMTETLETAENAPLSPLVNCLELLVAFNGRYTTTCHSYDAIAPLYALADEQPDIWSAWVEGVLDALSPCPEQIGALFDALIACWRRVTLVQATPTLTLSGQLDAGQPIFFTEVHDG